MVLGDITIDKITIDKIEGKFYFAEKENQCKGQMSIYDFPECLPQKEYEEMHELAIFIKYMVDLLPKETKIKNLPSYWSKYL